MFFEPLESRQMFSVTIPGKSLIVPTVKLPAPIVAPVTIVAPAQRPPSTTSKPTLTAKPAATKAPTTVPQKTAPNGSPIKPKSPAIKTERGSGLPQKQGSDLPGAPTSKLPGNLVNLPTDPLTGRPIIGGLLGAQPGADSFRSSFLQGVLAAFGKSLDQADDFMQSSDSKSSRPGTDGFSDFVTAETDALYDQHKAAKGDRTSQASSGPSVWDSIALGWQSFWADEGSTKTATEVGVALAQGETGDAGKTVLIEVGKKAADLDEKESAVADFALAIAETGAGAAATLASAAIATIAIALGVDTSGIDEGIRAVAGQSGDKDPRMPKNNGTETPDPNSVDGGGDPATAKVMAQIGVIFGRALAAKGSNPHFGQGMIAQYDRDGEVVTTVKPDREMIENLKKLINGASLAISSSKTAGQINPGSGDDGNNVNIGAATGPVKRSGPNVVNPGERDYTERLKRGGISTTIGNVNDGGSQTNGGGSTTGAPSSGATDDDQ